MKMDKEKWIDEVIGSTKERVPVSSNPFLYEKVMFRLQQKVTVGSAEKVFVYKWAAIVVLLVGINGVAMVNMLAHKHHNNVPQGQSIFSEMETHTYNY